MVTLRGADRGAWTPSVRSGGQGGNRPAVGRVPPGTGKVRRIPAILRPEERSNRKGNRNRRVFPNFRGSRDRLSFLDRFVPSHRRMRPHPALAADRMSSRGRWKRLGGGDAVPDTAGFQSISLGKAADRSVGAEPSRRWHTRCIPIGRFRRLDDAPAWFPVPPCVSFGAAGSAQGMSGRSGGGISLGLGAVA